MEGKQDNLKAYGDIAFICIKTEAGVPTKLYYGRNYGRPLKMARNELGMLLSSEGAGDEVPQHELFTFNYQLNRLTHRKFKVPSFDPEYVFPESNYSYKGSYQQPSTNNVCGGYEADRWDDYQIDEDGYAWYDTEDPFEDVEEDVSYERWDEDTQSWVYEQETVQVSVTRPTSNPTHISELLTPKLPSEEEVLNRVWQELAYADGHFSTAYWALEHKYDELEQQPTKTLETIRQLHLLSRAVDAINEMEGFEDDDSIHPMWGDQPLLTKGVTV